MEYCNLTNKIDSVYSNFSSSFKFNKTKKQSFTLSYSPSKDEYNYYLYIQIEPSNLDLKIKSFSDNETINAEEDYFFKINYQNMYFELTVSDEVEFNEFQFIVSRVREIKFYQKKYFLLYLILIIIAIIILISILVIIIIVLNRKKRKINDDDNNCLDKKDENLNMKKILKK